MQQTTAKTFSNLIPKFSIVIPTYKRLECLRDCLSGIASVSYAKSEFEVIVVDDCSDQDPANVVDAFRTDLKVQLLYQETNQGPAAARNRGARHARGKFLLFVDDDCVPCRNWLETIGGHLGDTSNMAVGGNCRNDLTDRICSEAHQMMMDYLNSYYNSDPAKARFCATNNLAIPRKAFLEMGGFDIAFQKAAGEDRDFSARWIRTGHDMVFVTDAPVHHKHALGLKEFLRMHYWYGRGAKRFHILEADKSVERGFEPFGFYQGLILFPFSQTTPARAISISLLQVLSQVAHTFGYLREA